ncbi:hypothetical protein ACCQ13_16810 [Xanthomonas sp. NCPPB 1638]|nr:hypothetical protein K6980_02905 [Xanthomonas cucurbitae]WDM84803.1 hypothetical protein K6979_02915 [Xanthomonas cucurbitae]
MAALPLRWSCWALALSLPAAVPRLAMVPLEPWFRRIGLPGQRRAAAR